MPAAKFGPLSTYIDLLLDTVCIMDVEGRFVYVSAGCEKVFGYTPEEMKEYRSIDLLHPDDLQITLQRDNEVMYGKPSPFFENRYIRKDGTIVHIMWSERWSEEDNLRIAVARDITNRVRSELKQRATYAISEAVHDSNDLPELFHLIHKIVADLLPIDSFNIAICDERPDCDAKCSLIYADPVCAQSAQNNSSAGNLQVAAGPRLKLAEQIITTKSALLTHVQADGGGVVNWIGAPLRARQHVLGALLVSRNDIHNNFSDADQELMHFVSVQIAAAVERQQMMVRLQQLALYDSLTSLPNRSLFEDRMRSALARARRVEASLSLLYIDLDRFKEVNDNYGHAIGDLLLEQVARRLETCVREPDTVARLGGDEFVVLLESMEHDDYAAAVVDRIRLALSDEFKLDSHRLHTSLSIGLAHYPHDGNDMRSLMHHADMQMYEVKRGADIQALSL